MTLAALALAALAAAGEGGPAQKLVLEGLDAREAPRPLAGLVEQRLCQALGERLANADLVCPEDVAAATEMARNDAIMGRCSSDACLDRVEEMRRAPRRLSARMARDGKGWLLTLVLRTDGEPEPRIAKARLPDDADAILSRVPDLVKQLL
ncbi:MAG: hypothetical protein U0229_01440 [Anaeromyxobacter sp.]